MNNQSTNSQTIIAEDVQIDGDIILSGNITIPHKRMFERS